ncbi:PTS fructose EIIBC subunit family protein [Sporolactobacillus sp. THM7-4]|nr:PTS fructose EIIBC subunit family protein [Sporolactobacillus sp. THM7-4]
MYQPKWKAFQEHLMTGISYMIPIIVPAGIIMGIGIMAGQFMGFDAWNAKLLQDSNNVVKLFAWLTQVAGAGMMGLMFPVFAAFVSYSISDKLGLAPGFIGGYLAKEMGSGFIGAVIIGMLAGYFVKYLNDKIKFNRTFNPVKTLFIIPVTSSLFAIIGSYFIVGPLGLLFIKGITIVIHAAGGTGQVTMAAVIGGSMGFDLGGPVNKTALALSMQLNTDTGANTWVPAMIGAVIPPIGIGLATIIDKFIVRRTVFEKNLKANGFPCFLLGFMGISEGAIPFAIKDPLFMIPINVIGSATGAAIAAALKTSAVTGVPAAIWGWPLSTNPLGWAIAVVIGSLMVCFGAIFRGNYVVRKREKKNNIQTKVKKEVVSQSDVSL